MADGHRDHPRHSNSSSNPGRIILEYDFFDESRKGPNRTFFMPLFKNDDLRHQIKPTAISSSHKNRDDYYLQQITHQDPHDIINLVQEIDNDHHQETSLSFLDASRYDQEKKNTSNFDVDSNLRRLSGMNLMVSRDSATSGLDNDLQEISPISSSFASTNSDHIRNQKRKRTRDDSLEGPVSHDHEKESLKATGKKKIIDTETDKKLQLFDGIGIDSRLTKGIIINEEEEKKKTGRSPNVNPHQEKRLCASSDVRYDQKRKRSCSEDTLEGPISQEKERLQAKGKEKITDSQESQLVDVILSLRMAKGIFINGKKTGRNPNVDHHREKQLCGSVAAPLMFHRRILEEIQQGHEPPVLLFEKELQVSDADRVLNRLFITRSEKLMGFLTAEERRRVEDKEGELVVITKEAQFGDQYILRLTKNNEGMIVLNNKWSRLLAAKRLQIGDLVQGWGYRPLNGKFRLALVFIRKLPD